MDNARRDKNVRISEDEVHVTELRWASSAAPPASINISGNARVHLGDNHSCNIPATDRHDLSHGPDEN